MNLYIFSIIKIFLLKLGNFSVIFFFFLNFDLHEFHFYHFFFRDDYVLAETTSSGCSSLDVRVPFSNLDQNVFRPDYEYRDVQDIPREPVEEPVAMDIDDFVAEAEAEESPNLDNLLDELVETLDLDDLVDPVEPVELNDFEENLGGLLDDPVPGPSGLNQVQDTSSTDFFHDFGLSEDEFFNLLLEDLKM